MAFLQDYTICCDISDCTNEITIKARSELNALNEIKKQGWYVKSNVFMAKPREYDTYCPKHKNVS